MVEVCKYLAEEAVANKSKWMLIKMAEEKLEEAGKSNQANPRTVIFYEWQLRETTSAEGAAT